MWKKLLNTLLAEVVEPGRHARLRGVWGNPSGFESRLRHQFYNTVKISETWREALWRCVISVLRLDMAASKFSTLVVR